ncbi:hypothetical protein TRVL_00074 [Trypanosoma vivax]|nr:hypothetical protein TRVL_00074 [Trypanosoma vivax]
MKGRKRFAAGVLGVLDHITKRKYQAESSLCTVGEDEGESVACEQSGGGLTPGSCGSGTESGDGSSMGYCDKRWRASVQPHVAVHAASSQRSTTNSFASEINFLCRGDEEVVDMCLYLAQLLSTARTCEAFVALLNLLVEHGADTVMASLRRAGLQSHIFSLLCKVSVNSVTAGNERLFFLVFAHLIALSEREAICNDELVCFLVDSLRPKEKGVVGDHVKKFHWSACARRPNSSGMAAENGKEPAKAVGRLIKSDEGSSAASLVLRALLDIVFYFNGRASLPGEKNVSVIFVQHGGLELAAGLMNGPECVDALHLLEVVTLCESLKENYAVELQKAVLTVAQFVVDKAGACADDLLNAALRVLTNLTSLVPWAFHGETEEKKSICTALVAVIIKTLVDADAMPDTLALALCLTTNIVKWEADEGCSEFTALLVRLPSFLQRVAVLMLRAYNAEGTEWQVIAGYYALLLAVLSLCDSPSLQLRIPVTTSITNAAKRTSAGKAAEEKPMALIVAILQEFVLFHSAARALTKDNLRNMNGVIEEVMKRNGIEISATL